jgi:hypothetical protein
LVDPLSKDERNLTDRSRDMPVQSSQSASTTLVNAATQQNCVQKIYRGVTSEILSRLRILMQIQS